jgi:hypothetical protein
MSILIGLLLSSLKLHEYINMCKQFYGYKRMSGKRLMQFRADLEIKYYRYLDLQRNGDGWK